MRMAVAVVPGLFVPVVAAGRNEFVQQVGQVFEQTRFVFDGAQRARAADVEHVRRARAHAGIVNNLGHVRRQVMQLPVSPGFQQDLFLVNHVLLLRGTGPERKAFGYKWWSETPSSPIFMSLATRHPSLFLDCQMAAKIVSPKHGPDVSFRLSALPISGA